MSQETSPVSELSEEGVMPRDPEGRGVSEEDEQAIRDKNMEKTLADTFPTSDPPSSIPNPGEEED